MIISLRVGDYFNHCRSFSNGFSVVSLLRLNFLLQDIKNRLMDRGGEEEGEGGMNGESSMETYPFSRDLPNPGIEPRPPTLQADSLPAEPQGKPKNTGVSSLSLLQQIF